MSNKEVDPEAKKHKNGSAKKKDVDDLEPATKKQKVSQEGDGKKISSKKAS